MASVVPSCSSRRESHRLKIQGDAHSQLVKLVCSRGKGDSVDMSRNTSRFVFLWVSVQIAIQVRRPVGRPIQVEGSARICRHSLVH